MLLLAYWGLILATGCYAMLAVWRMAIARDHDGALYLALAFAGMASWTGALLTDIPGLVVASEVLRDFGWLAYLYGTTRTYDQQDEVRRAIWRFCVFLGMLVIARTTLSAALFVSAIEGSAGRTIFLLTLVIRWTYALTGIVFAHYLYRATASSAASGFRLIVVSLAVIWAYNLNLFTLLLLGYRQALLLSDLRGLIVLLLVPGFALAARRKERWKVTLSRQATTQSLLLVAIGTYFVVVSTATRALIWAGGHAADLAKILVAVALTLLLLAFGLMPRLRARLKAVLVRNLFEHRYDYRSEWLRFSSTIGDRATPGLSTEERAIRSVIDVTESVGGALLVVERGDRLVLAGTWQWPAHGLFSHALPVDPVWLENLACSARILTLDDVRARGGSMIEDVVVPEWLLGERHAWAVVPLVRSNRLVGLILLGRPRLDRDLDWEDFDLLKVIAQQVAVHLTDAQGQAELEEARRFDEFNRRFAFIIHDLKNVVSQLSLVSSNAAEHGANPKFQAAMARTLENATAKMSTLLARLSSDREPAEPTLGEVRPAALLLKLARENRVEGSVGVSIEQECIIRADEEQLLEALGHLVTNAIEASPADAMVFLSLTIWDGTVIIAVEDHGCGMSPDFIRKELFKPFASTKQNGFGIGAAEARALVLAMGGDLDVISVEGEGTRFLVRFPLLSSPDSDRN
ncbi:MAG: multi-sensor signal transduction histidine kinase [Bradyrhizobium sp.]|nr:multi-sensor signal transduction histidine kinase [Bradyrhizobium sp.]